MIIAVVDMIKSIVFHYMGIVFLMYTVNVITIVVFPLLS